MTQKAARGATTIGAAEPLGLSACARTGSAALVDLNSAGPREDDGGTILLQVRLGGKQAICLWDTGAETNFLAQHFVEQHALQSRLEASGSSVRYADGSVKRAHGELTLPVSLLMDGTTYDCRVRFVVADLQQQFDFILGMSFCVEHEPTPHWGRGTIHLPNQRPGRGGQPRDSRRAQASSLRDARNDHKGTQLGEISLSAWSS